MPLLFVAFFLWLAYRQSRRVDVGLPVWIPPVYLAIKFAVGYVVFLIFTKHYPERADADIFKYFDDAMVLFNYMQLDGASVIPIMLKSELPVELAPRMKSWFSGGGFNLFDSSQVMVKIHVLIRLVSFGSYHVHSLVFCFLSYLGCMFLLRSVRGLFQVNPWLVLACLCFPSFLLWSSAPLKESVSVWLIMVAVGVFLMYLKHSSPIHWMIAVLVLLPLYMIKPFYVLILLLCMLLVFANRNGTVKVLLFQVVCLVGMLWIADLVWSDYSPIDIMARKQRDYFDHFEWQSARSMSGIPPLEPHLFGLFKLLPYVLMNVFLKPLPWESLNVLYLASSIENLVVVVLFVLTIVAFLKSDDVFMRRTLLLLLLFFFLTYLVLGFSCPVIGSLMRFKSPVLVFVPLAFVLGSGFMKKRFPPINR